MAFVLCLSGHTIQTAGASKAVMSVSGPCTLCTTNDVVDSCDRCGALVCDDHYDSRTGWCTECANELNTRQDAGEQPEPEDTYRF